MTTIFYQQKFIDPPTKFQTGFFYINEMNDLYAILWKMFDYSLKYLRP